MRDLRFFLIPLALIAAPSIAASKATGEEQLAKLLAGRTAGEPVDCIRQSPSSSMTVIDRTAIVFGRGDTIYVNRTQDPASLDDDDGLLLRKYGDAGRLCSTDTMTTFDRVSQFYTGNVFLTEFVPYKRQK